MNPNLDKKTVEDFGREWSRFNQDNISKSELDSLHARYFSILPTHYLQPTAVAADFGCGSGRWATRIAPLIRNLHCIDASADAIKVSKKNLAGSNNCVFFHGTIEDVPISTGTLDFAYSLGVLHHTPDPLKGLKSCVSKLKPGAPFLLYLYYRFDQRPIWFRALWKLSDYLRVGISALPFGLKKVLCDAIALAVYWPLSRLGRLGVALGFNVSHWPLSSYRALSLTTLRTDALDRFGTRLEWRFTQAEMHSLMSAAGLHKITFSESAPYWVALGYRQTHE